MWGEPVEQVQLQIQKVKRKVETLGRDINFGMRINLIIANTEKEAWHKAEQMVKKVDDSHVKRLNQYISNSDSTALRRIQSLNNKMVKDKCFWTGMVPYRSGNSTALVGSVEQIKESLQKYVEAGITEFIFSSYPHIETVSYVGEKLIPLLKETVLS